MDLALIAHVAKVSDIKLFDHTQKFIKYFIVGSVEKIQKVKIQKLQGQKKQNNRIIMLLSKCAVCDCKKSKFIKQQEASGLLSSSGKKTPLNKISLLGPLLF